MATAKELGLKPGDHVVWASAHMHTKNGMISGIPLNTEGATVDIGFGKVLAVNSLHEGIRPPAPSCTKIRIISTNYTDDTHPEYTKFIGSGFINFIGEGDERLKKELEGTDLRITICRTPEGERRLEVSKISSETEKDI